MIGVTTHQKGFMVQRQRFSYPLLLSIVAFNFIVATMLFQESERERESNVMFDKVFYLISYFFTN